MYLKLFFLYFIQKNTRRYLFQILKSLTGCALYKKRYLGVFLFSNTKTLDARHTMLGVSRFEYQTFHFHVPQNEYILVDILYRFLKSVV